MEKIQRALHAPVLAATLLFGSSIASAAHLELLDHERSEEASPAEAASGTSCTPVANQTIESFVSADGRRASSLVTQQFTVCNDSDGANAHGQQTSVLQLSVEPDPGERVGDDVTFCLETSFRQSAIEAGACTAESTIGGGDGMGPATVVRNPSGSAVTVFSFGPTTVMGNDPPFSEGERSMFQAKIGDEIEVEHGHESLIECTDPGTASTDARSFIALSVGRCVQPAPVTSPAGTALLALILIAMGSIVLIRRSV